MEITININRVNLATPSTETASKMVEELYRSVRVKVIEDGSYSITVIPLNSTEAEIAFKVIRKYLHKNVAVNS